MNKKTGVILGIFLFFLFFSFSASADMGPKPFTEIEISGIEGEYVAALAAKEASGPNFTYEDYQNQSDPFLTFHPIMEYTDEDGFRWITTYWECEGDSVIRFGYHPLKEFKLILYRQGELFFQSVPLKRYAFSSYFHLTASEGTYQMVRDYDYSKEIGSFFLRLIVTLTVEIALFFCFFPFEKRNFATVCALNFLTQVILNVLLNLYVYYQGPISMIILYFPLLVVLELLIFAVEWGSYLFFFRNVSRKRIFWYSFSANLLSFAMTFVLASVF